MNDKFFIPYNDTEKQMMWKIDRGRDHRGQYEYGCQNIVHAVHESVWHKHFWKQKRLAVKMNALQRSTSHILHTDLQLHAYKRCVYGHLLTPRLKEMYLEVAENVSKITVTVVSSFQMSKSSIENINLTIKTI